MSFWEINGYIQVIRNATVISRTCLQYWFNDSNEHSSYFVLHVDLMVNTYDVELNLNLY